MVIQMKKFVYRRPRYRVDIPIVVHVTPLYSIWGRCTEISAEGAGVRQNEELRLDEMVEVEFALRGSEIRVVASIQYRYHENCYGLKFHFSSEQERDSFRDLLETIHRIK
jgi:hypothetical protein